MVPRKLKAEKEFKLEDHLILAQTIASKLGIENLNDIAKFAENNENEVDGTRSGMYYSIIQKPGQRKLPETSLQKYDDNIEKYLTRLRKTWGQELNLKHYQYISSLFAEIYLDNYFQGPKEFIKTLNTWNHNRGSKESIPKSVIEKPKLAYWMATGSGKTLIMHLNLLQFLEYNKGPHRLDYKNIILVTSNDNMSEQHKRELRRSGISADLFDGNTRGYFRPNRNKVKIISIHKLKLPGEKTGKGKTIDVSSLGTKNLVFIDEGHKGQKSEDAKWKAVREKLAEDGFIWEYSATFGQTITSKNSPYFNEYRYSILFDYSYKFFHKDGYGKDFNIVNLKTSEFKDTYIPTLLLANTISYYEQLQIFRNTPNLKEYNIEKPLWIFVGSKVNKEDSDIHQVVKFLHNLFQTDPENIIQEIDKILDGRSGIPGPDNKDAFARHFPEKNFTYLREENIDPKEIYQGILRDIFNIKPGTTPLRLELHNIKNAEGEIGLRSTSSEHYFGVINIGDKLKFLRIIRATSPKIPIREDAFSSSQFDIINNKTSNINLLLGAKKFIEGWNSWRVSNMCLLNIGKREGPQIIQLFGRGVRLKGQNMSLKRSDHMPGIHPKYIEILETLKIFGIQANYLKQFQEYINLEVDPVYNLGFDTKRDHLNPFPSYLYTLTLEKGYNFKDYLFEFNYKTFIDNENYPLLDFLPKTDIIDSRELEPIGITQKKTERIIDKAILEILDWDEIYHEILSYKHTRGIHNIHIKKESLKPILESNRYILYCDPTLINPTRFPDIQKTQEIVIQILKNCIAKYYKKIRLGEEEKHIELTPVLNEENRITKKYEIIIKTKNPGTVKIVEDIIHRIHDKDFQTRLSGDYIIPAHFSNHLYLPLLSKPATDEITLKPTGLNEGETRFVRDLEKYLNENEINREIYLLRNLTKGKGVGFFEENAFYPDFILWLINGDKQKIVFIDPKGIGFYHLNHRKLTLHNYLKTNVQLQITESGVTLDAYILSVTAFDKYRTRVNKSREMLAKENHLIFMYDVGTRVNPNYMTTLFNYLLNE